MRENILHADLISRQSYAMKQLNLMVHLPGRSCCLPCIQQRHWNLRHPARNGHTIHPSRHESPPSSCQRKLFHGTRTILDLRIPADGTECWCSRRPVSRNNNNRKSWVHLRDIQTHFHKCTTRFWEHFGVGLQDFEELGIFGISNVSVVRKKEEIQRVGKLIQLKFT